jgi:hypothetical protein
MMATGTMGAVLAAELPFRLLLPGALLAGTLLLAAIAIALVSRWRRRSGSECLTPADQLTHFRSLYERGTISAEEFQRVRAFLAGKAAGPVDAAKPDGIRKAASAAEPPAGEPPQPPPDGVRPA